ncbi:unnamed protein product [Phaedon cochleariae]|uniref:Ankyrin repeat protein n=1 Tax=Phaedon cochleariae TaxID=80249 RepID=A0A9N9SCU8_PHACE|nr:unnamed protein product [Phaedon cochleariae]
MYACIYGRLNVLRWLLWEAESRDEMPALEKGAHHNGTTLALHYAAARGCLDCVRLLDNILDIRIGLVIECILVNTICIMDNSDYLTIHNN